ncbi:ornithine decarboxylase-like isoform X2 [Hyperolius riggenbachi]|uniref:ornithine decarboxylase-like isoform X2 n=1 Tax=Hyperolius riggenbachi TaxID=752182 RepID=UPI0035A3B154
MAAVMNGITHKENGHLKERKDSIEEVWRLMRDSTLTVVEDGITALDFLKEKTKDSLNDDKDAFFVADLDDVARKHWRFMEGLPRVRPYYAVKCNDNPEILRTLAVLGTGFDCASKAEISMILGMGIPATDIIYANTCKQASHIRHAAAHGVTRMTFDCESELEKVADNHPNAEMILRIRTDDNGSVSCLSKKFGAPLENCEHLLKLAKSLNVFVTGVSFHMGSGTSKTEGFRQAIGNARHLFDVGNKLGHKMRVLDIGGGFPGHPDFKPVFEEYFPEEEGVEIIAEPGQYYVTSAFIGALSVTTKKQEMVIGLDGKSKRKLSYYMNDGLFGSFLLSKLYKKEMRLKPFLEKDWLPSTECFPSTLWGPNCTEKDVIMKNVDLPELEVGDYIFFPHMGAYYPTVYTVFNGFLPPPVFCIVSKDLWSSMKKQWKKLANNTP